MANINVGPSLPFALHGSAMVTSSNGKGVIMIGGGYDRTENSLYELHGEYMSWVLLKKRLQYGRTNHVALSVPDDYNLYLFGIVSIFYKLCICVHIIL